jgi:hypothetical protein
MVMAKRAVDII